MAIQFQVSEWIGAPPARVYAVATDLDSAAEWMNGLERIEWLTEGGFRPGARWREVRRMFGKEAAEEFEVVHCEPGQSFTLAVDGRKGSTGRGAYRFEHRLEPEREGTRFTMDASITGMGWMGRLLGPFMQRAFRKAICADLNKLKERIEAEPAPVA